MINYIQINVFKTQDTFGLNFVIVSNTTSINNISISILVIIMVRVKSDKDEISKQAIFLQ